MARDKVLERYVADNPDLQQRAIEIGARFKAARENSKKSKTAVAKLARMSTRTITNIENGSYVLKIIAPIQMYLDACGSDLMVDIQVTRIGQ